VFSHDKKDKKYKSKHFGFENENKKNVEKQQGTKLQMYLRPP
jgi:hypothetical protein